MGNLALQSIFGGGDISKLHGKLIDKKYFVTYCPSEALKSSKIKRALKKDVQKLEVVLKGKK